ncbi:CARDB domain-containing protein [Halorubrum sp. SP9]|uniref:CARDB domain-containing protein n=2 Tax=unclassified Halorubrum TaxID=2642239 RepID=UPI0010F620DD|nr:CARDB domain-containing protein [Halorubrum sp. SP9]TKX69224.1 hypothetical protein EXE45_08875 [Halorubrum sp. SP9]
MDDEPSRRSLLSTSTILGLGLLAGCGQQEQDDETESESGTASDQSETAEDPLTIGESTLDPSTLSHGNSVTVTVTLENTGADEISRSVPLSVGGERVASQMVTIAPGESTELDLSGEPSETGTQAVTVGTEEVGTVVVRASKPAAVREIGAHYYPWYGAPLHDYNDGEWAKESPSTPVLGNYNSVEPAVIEQHIDWCRRAGISWLNVSWWGPNSGHDRRLREDVLAHPRADELEWSILYETVGQFGDDPVELDTNSAQSQLTNDLRYLAETYFHRDNYKRIDGRPVLYIWVAQNLRGDVQEAYQAAVEAAGERPYLIVDIPAGSGLDTHPIVDVADAVSTYSVYDPDNPTKDAFIETARSSYRTWYRAVEYVDVDVIPTAVPGFDDTEITHVERNNEPVPPTPDIYEQTATAARRYADGPILITSFNEWYEDTQVEPSEEHGTAYLERTADTLATGEREDPTYNSEMFTLAFERTISESTLNPDIENGRQLTFLLNRLIIYDGAGETVLDIDIGPGVDEVAFILGSYGPGQADGDSWRWLGGESETVVSVPSLPEGGRIELTGRGAGEMDLTLEIDGTQQDTIEITEQSDTYSLSLN